MKKIIVSLVSLLILAIPSFVNAQAKKPSVMVIPSDQWMTQNGYMTQQEAQGEVTYVPDYNKALNEDPNLNLVINKIGGMFHERGFDLGSLNQALKKLKTKAAEDAVNRSKNSGAAVSTNGMDQLLKTVRPDIVLQLTYKLNQRGPKKSVTFDLTAVDAYSDEIVGQASGTGLEQIGGIPDAMLEEAVLSHIDNFQESLQTYFDDILENGRKINLTVKVWDDAPFDLEEEFDDEELTEVIDNWVSENTVNHRYSNDGGTEHSVEFTGVRIPVYYMNKNGQEKANDANAFGRKLQRFLKQAPYNIEAKVQARGQGRVIVMLGGK